MRQKSRSGNSKWAIIVVVILGLAAVGGNARRLELDQTDICFFICDSCYKGETLLHCANQCITTEGLMGPVWMRTCPPFTEQMKAQQHQENVKDTV